MKQNIRGFTLIEITIVVAILTFLATFGVVVSLDFYRTYAFRSERNTIVSLLEKARAASLNNIDDVSHGVHFDENNFVLFEGTSYSSGDLNNLNFASSSSVKLTSNSSLPVDVIFARLSAETTPITFTLQDLASNRTDTISINIVGQIDW